jgi:predicted nuclease of predicted toxin-antitoxin system
MRFKIDENLPAEMGATLRDLGHLADTVAEEGLSGSTDASIVEAARRDDRILLTLDKGISLLVRSLAEPHAGIVLLRPGSLGQKAVVSFIRSRLTSLLVLELKGRITVVTPSGIRVR